MREKRDMRFFFYVGPAVIVTFSILALIIVLLKPQKISQDILESVEFQEGVSERVKRLTGLDLVYSELKATADLRFTLHDVRLSKARDGQTVHSCTSPEVRGKFASQGLLFSLASMQIDELNCAVSLTEDYQPIPLVDRISPQISDLDLLFGVSLSEAQINRLSTQIVRLDSGGNPLESYWLKDSKVQLSFSLGLLEQKASFIIENEDVPLAIEHNTPQFNAHIKAHAGLNVSYDGSSGAAGAFSFQLLEQNLVPSYLSELYPTRVSFAFRGPGRIPEKLQLSDVQLTVRDVLTAEAASGEFAIMRENHKAQFALSEIQAETHPELLSLFGLNPASYDPRLARVSNATLSGLLQLDGIRPVLDARLTAQHTQVTLVPESPFHLNGLSAEFGIRPSDSHALNLSVSIDAREASFPHAAYVSRDLNLRGRATLHGDERLDIHGLHLSTRGHDTQAEVRGRVKWIDGLPSDLNLSGRIAQELSVTLFDQYDIDGSAEIPFQIETLQDGTFRASATLKALLEKVTHPDLRIENLRAETPINVHLAAGIPSGLLARTSVSGVLDDLTSAVGSWDGRISAEIGLLEVIQDAKNAENNLSLRSIAVSGNVGQSGWGMDDTSSEGTLSVGSYQAPSPAGFGTQNYTDPVQISWTFQPVDAVTPGVRLRGTIKRPEFAEPVIAEAHLSAPSDGSLNIDYSSPSDLFAYLADVTGFQSFAEMSGLRTQGSITFKNFFAAQQEDEWRFLVAELPYNGEVEGVVSFTSSSIQFDSIQNTEMVSIARPNLVVRHSGTSQSQVLKMSLVADQVRIDLVDGQKYQAARVSSHLSGKLELPFPAPEFSLWGSLTTGPVSSLHDSVVSIPATTFEVAASLLDGTSLKIERLIGYLDQEKVLNLAGYIDSFHPIRGVEMMGEVHPYLPAFPAELFGARLASNAKAYVPVSIRSVTDDKIVVEGYLQASGINIEARDTLVGGLEIKVPFGFVLTVEPNNALVLEVDPLYYSQYDLTKKGYVRAGAQSLLPLVRPAQDRPQDPAGQQLRLVEGQIFVSTQVSGNRILFDSETDVIEILDESGRRQGHRQAEVILDERGMILNVGSEEFLVLDPVIDHTY